MKKSKEEPCVRCGSEKIVSKTWVEKVKTFGGTSTLVHSQLVCVNEECQAAFEKNRRKELKRVREQKKKKEERELEKKKNMIKARKEKARLKQAAGIK